MGAPVSERLLGILAKIDRPGTFCTRGCLPSIVPGLEVAGVGPVALPLDAHQAEALKRIARQAPYGKGTQTLVDTDIRRVWEIDADQVVLANPEWADAVKQAVHAAQAELGLEQQPLEAHLYKLLLYEPGSFFLAHRDGEKLDRMVATLVIALPSAHEGGELVVRHEGREEVVDFSAASRFQTQFAAFYADCEHEIRRVRTGFRLALVYNLTLEKSRRGIKAPTSHEHVTAAAGVLRDWIREQEATPESNAKPPAPKMAVLLDHQYTETGLAIDALKGVDRARADVLFAAAHEANCDASLALVTFWQSGSAEPSGGYGSRRYRRYGRYEDDYGDEDAGEHVMGEVFDSSLSAKHFSDGEGNRLDFGAIPLDEDEIVSNEPLGSGEPDREDFEGYTGNAGMTLDRWYHRAAIMLWPPASRFDVLCDAGVEAAVGGLDQMVRRWKLAPKRAQKKLVPACLEFARRIIARWPERTFGSGYHTPVRFDAYDGSQADGAGRETAPPRLLALLGELADVTLIAAYIREVLARDVSVDPGTTLGDLCQQHGWTTFQEELLEVFRNTSTETLERHARLLADWSRRTDKHADRRKLCSLLAQQVMSTVERWDPKAAKADWRARVVDRGALLPPLTQAFLALNEPELLERLTAYVRDRPREFDLTAIQVPALLSLKPWLEQNVKQPSAPLNQWLAAVVAELDRRKSRPPQAPTDWRRESATGCGCADCKELSRFLEDPNAKAVRLPLAETRRRHIHNVIDRQKLDTTHVTERIGRPYTLVCTKTTASYERALKAHHVDLDHLANMQDLLEWHEGLSPPSSVRGTARRQSKGHRP